MNIDNFNFFDDNDNDFECKSSYPLFNFDALRKSQSQEFPINLITSDKVSEIVEEILTKKVKIDNNQAIPKKRGRKAVPKNAKGWDDPNITIQEIIENDLVGVPMKSEIKMREDRLKKIQDKKAQKKAEREKGATVEIKAIENFIPAAPAFNLEPIVFKNEPIFAPQIVFRDGKMVIDNSALAIREDRDQKLAIADTKPRKLTSMSFRTRNNTAKWTPEETKKFYKSIEIFGADFSLIAKLFPTRNRDQIKNKFNKEEKTNANKINETFKRNTLLSKRSIMDRIRNFNNILNNDQIAISAPTEFDIEAGGIKALERQYSNTSTDSMDLKIMEEIQDIFIKEIRPRNTISIGFPNTVNMIADRPFGFSNPQDNSILMDINENIPRDTQNVNKENLLLRLI